MFGVIAKHAAGFAARDTELASRLPITAMAQAASTKLYENTYPSEGHWEATSTEPGSITS
jgi:hypothetical protein